MTIENCSVTDNLANENARLKETIAAQAAVIEKLRGVLNDSGRLYCTMLGNELMTTPSVLKRSIVCKFVRGWFREMQPTTIQKALATPTDNNKEVLKAWLDEVLGEPVAWWRKDKHGVTWYYSQDEDHHEGSIPLFRKPAL